MIVETSLTALPTELVLSTVYDDSDSESDIDLTPPTVSNCSAIVVRRQRTVLAPYICTFLLLFSFFIRYFNIC